MGQEQKTRALYGEQVRREQAQNSLTFDLSASLQPGEQPACACNPGTTAMPMTQPPPARERAGHESARAAGGRGVSLLFSFSLRFKQNGHKMVDFFMHLLPLVLILRVGLLGV